MPPIFTVTGATGAQGTSIVTEALKSKAWIVRAVTRNINSDKANALKAQGVEVVTANVNDEATLIKAFEVCPLLYSFIFLSVFIT
jgi:uncharacterized protein YbjT (DUF2867 family)